MLRRREFVRGLTSLPESNSAVVNPYLHVWCFRVARQAPSLYGATEGSASEAADVGLESFGLSRGLSAAAESAFPEGAIASILRDAFGGERRSRTGRPQLRIHRARKALSGCVSACAREKISGNLTASPSMSFRLAAGNLSPTLSGAIYSP